MMKSEFEERIGTTIPEEEYEIIETVYTWYDDSLDKDETARLYSLLGIAVFRDMYSRAVELQALDDAMRGEQQQHRERMDELVTRITQLKRGE